MDYVKDTDGSLKESPELIQARLRDALSPFGDTLAGVPSITESPLTDFLLNRQLVCIDYEGPTQLVAHLKHSILRWLKKRLLGGTANLEWHMTDPRTIVDAAFGTSKDWGSKTPDMVQFHTYQHSPLLVIRASSFPRHRMPQELLSGMLRYREEARLPTVLCYPAGVPLFAQEADRNDPDLIAILGRTSVVELRGHEFPAELKPKPKAKKR